MHHHVRQQNREGLIAHHVARAPDGVAEAQRLLLAGEAGLPCRRQILFEDIELNRLAALAQR